MFNKLKTLFKKLYNFKHYYLNKLLNNNIYNYINNNFNNFKKYIKNHKFFIVFKLVFDFFYILTSIYLC